LKSFNFVGSPSSRRLGFYPSTDIKFTKALGQATSLQKQSIINLPTQKSPTFTEHWASFLIYLAKTAQGRNKPKRIATAEIKPMNSI
jgi:hypothetical protein